MHALVLLLLVLAVIVGAVSALAPQYARFVGMAVALIAAALFVTYLHQPMIPWSVVFDRGGWALAGVAFMLVFFGLLVPRSTVKERDEALAKERQRNDNLAESVKNLLMYAEATNRILDELNRRRLPHETHHEDRGAG